MTHGILNIPSGSPFSAPRRGSTTVAQGKAAEAAALGKTHPTSLLFFILLADRSHFVVEGLATMVYVSGMSQTLEKRVEELEHKLAELTNAVTARKPRKKDWQKTFGLSRDDDGFNEMVNLGREYRQSLRDKGKSAGS